MAQGKADLVLHEGVVAGHSDGDSLAVAGGRIVALGTFKDIKPLVGPQTHLVKLAGRAVAPGFIDSHLHFLEAASVSSSLRLGRARTMADLLSELRTAAARTPPGNWLKAFGCDESLLKERRGPTRAELDGAVAKNPLRLRHQTLHASWLNSRAIEALGLEKADFKPPEGAQLLRGANGLLSGLAVGMEEWLTRRLPPVTSADLEIRARSFSRELAAAGVTAFTDATARNGLDEVRLLGRLARAHAIYQRAFVMLGWSHLEEAAEARAAARAAGMELIAIKFMPTASVDRAELASAIVKASGLGLACAFHATEVEELEAALGSSELALRRLAPGESVQIRIEHGGVIPPNYLSRIRASGAWVVTNPGFIHFRGAKYLAEPGLAPFLYRARSLQLAGVPLAAATDAPVTPARPMAAIAAAISRTTAEGVELGPGEKIDLADALALFTRSAARLVQLEAGELDIGRLADLIVLRRDPVKLGPAELMTLPVDMTIIGGQVVYERNRPAPPRGTTG